MRSLKYLCIILTVIFANKSFAQKNETVNNFLSVSEPINFDNENYYLVWSSHPSENYYKQEYLPKNQSLEKFTKMILVEVMIGFSIEDIVNYKVAELDERKKSDPIANYKILTKDGELVFDFILAAYSKDGTDVDIVERNVYHYKYLNDFNGQKAVVLFGVSERAYGRNVEKFFKNLESNKNKLLKSVTGFIIPEVKINE